MQWHDCRRRIALNAESQHLGTLSETEHPHLNNHQHDCHDEVSICQDMFVYNLMEGHKSVVGRRTQRLPACGTPHCATG